MPPMLTNHPIGTQCIEEASNWAGNEQVDQEEKGKDNEGQQKGTQRIAKGPELHLVDPQKPPR